jgi:putative nucleotidyltransferase with HDIG domain
MKLREYVYWAAVTAAAVAFCALVDWSTLLSLSQGDWLGLSTFVLLAVISQYLAVDSTLGTIKPVKASIAFLPLLALAVVMPVSALVLATASMTAVHELFFRERALGRTAFNISQTVLSYGIAATVFQHLSTIPEDTSVTIFSLFFPFYGLALTFFGLNIALVSTAIALRQSERFRAVLREAVGRGGGNFLYDLLASPFALFAAYLYQNFHIPGLLIGVVPFVFIRVSYLSGIRLQQTNQDLLKVLVKAIETRDPYTSGHSVRVATLSRMIAIDYGLRPSGIANVETAALLHDIGKIDAQFAQIISKPSDLSEDERRLIRTHATAGADLLESLTSVDKEVIVGVRHHHEQYDGTGYPGQLSGKAIPIAARIIMISDSVDAMLSDRPYRNALSIEKVRDELVRCAGTQFDPDLVKAILENDTLERAEVLVGRSGARSTVQATAAHY